MKIFFEICTVGSPFLSDFLAYRNVPQQTVYRSKKNRTIQMEISDKNATYVFMYLKHMSYS
jgi:hypothetical protein